MQSSTKESSTVSTSQFRLWLAHEFRSALRWTTFLLGYPRGCNKSFALLIEQGYVLISHRRAVVTSKELAIAVYHRIYPPYALHSPSPLEPAFDLSIAALGLTYC
eukprot:6186968-Pleurochrysis_carterae.AAC.2